MAERPLLILPSPGQPLAPVKKSRFGGQYSFPNQERQGVRLTAKFARLQEAFEARRLRLMTAAGDLVPEDVVVLETVGTTGEFIRTIEAVPGLEWLAEHQIEDIPPDDDFFVSSSDDEVRSNKSLQGRVFMVFSDQTALHQMVSLWNAWLDNKSIERGFGSWKILFRQLRDVRTWGVKDRLLETGILEDWQARINDGQEHVPCEIELWCRRNPDLRRIARDRVIGIVEEIEGQLIAEAEIEEISYHSLLVKLPAHQIHPLLDSSNYDIALVQCEQIQFFRASGQMLTLSSSENLELDEGALSEQPISGSPVVALFDGLPLQTHRRLRGHLIIDDPDGFERDCPASTRRHGTAMASLIIHGDLAADETPLQRPLYVRPILKPNPNDWLHASEAVPEGMLVVDLVHRAVRRLFEEVGGEAPVAPDISIINLSIGIRDRPFDQGLSPLARLLDWLAWRYNVLFIVSAGNYASRIELFPAHEPQQPMLAGIQEQFVRAIAADAKNRRLLSPAESVNALTVASTHDDASNGPLPHGWSDPFGDPGLPSPFNAQGMGFRRGIKPDLLAAGGRVLVQKALGGGNFLELFDFSGPPGQKIASPGRNPGDRNAVQHTRGTSNATALVSRACCILHDELDNLREDPGGDVIDRVSRAVWIKALVAHGAEWGEAGSILTQILKNEGNSRKFKEYVTRLLGYGTIDVNKVQECTSRRVTALSGGALGRDESHIHAFPLPPSLNGWKGHQKLSITLAWITPINRRHQAWRSAALWFEPINCPLQVKRQQADWQAVKRGTVQHEVFEGKRAVEFIDDANIEIQVNCRAGAGNLEEEVPYARAMTLEVAETLDADIYAEVRAAIHAVQVQSETDIES